MEMTVLEKSLHQARNDINKAISQLAETAMEDSDTYNAALEKLTHFKWKFTGQTASLMIDMAIELIKKRALDSSIEKPLI